MAEIPITDRLWMVREALPGVPEPVLFRRYMQAAKDFFRRSNAWVYVVTDVDDDRATTGLPFVDLYPYLPVDTSIVDILSIKYQDGTPIRFMARDQLNEQILDWQNQEGTNKPDYYTLIEPGSWSFVPSKPSQDLSAAFTFRVSLAPKVPDRTTLPDFLLDEWDEALAAGALASLYALPGRDWSDVNLATAHSIAFESWVIKARSRAEADYGQPVRTVVYGGIPF